MVRALSKQEIMMDSSVKDADEFYSVSPIFVPAVEEKYQKDAEVKHN